MTSELPTSLPWDQLDRRHKSVPWPALHAFAEALVADRALVPRLIEVYDRAYETASAESGYADFYVAGIFALAAPSLGDERRREIGSLLTDRLVRAGRDDADVSLEILTAAVGTLGPVILPAVLDAIAAEPDTRGAWVFLWSLTTLAAQTDDEDLRSRVVQACVDLLERVERGQVDSGDGTHAAWTLASLKRTEYKGLLLRVTERAKNPFWDTEYEEALDLLEDRLDYTPPPELWEQSVEEWLAPRCGQAQAPSHKETGELTQAQQQKSNDMLRAGLVTMSFVSSPVAAALPRELRKYAHLIVRHLVHHSFTDLNLEPAEWEESAMRQLLLDIMPRSHALDDQAITFLIPVTEAFLYWLHVDGQLVGADTLAQTIHGWTSQVIETARNSKKTAPEPSRQRTAPDTVDSGIKRQPEENTADHPTASQPQAAPQEWKPPIPIVERGKKIARNAPCPCGSGKKYKKCHGRSDTAAPAD